MRNKKGFTLVEMIAALVVLGFLAAGLSVMISNGVQAYVNNRRSAEAAQKAQFAMRRITRELLDLTSISAASGNSITYESLYGTFTMALSGSQINLSQGGTTKPIIDDVATYTGGDALFKFYRATSATTWGTWTTANPLDELGRIEVTLLLDITYSGGDTSTLRFVSYVSPRNTGSFNAPK